MDNLKHSIRILVIRNDKLGDFMLAWPAFECLKYHWPEAHITALVPEYTAPIAALCPYINELLIEPPDCNILVLLKMIREAKQDAMLTLFSTTRIALAGLLAKIPYRLAPATKIAQCFYNHKLTQRRSRSTKPEYFYNIELAVRLLIDFKKIPENFSIECADNDYLPTWISRPLLTLSGNVKTTRAAFLQKNKLTKESKLIFIHSGSGGSSASLTAGQFAHLADEISHQFRKAQQKAAIVICAGPTEIQQVKKVQEKLSSGTVSCVYHSTQGLEKFAETLKIADVFISGSTGTLHIAGALDIFNVGFYPGKRSSTSLRWQTLGNPRHRLTFSLPPLDSSLSDTSLNYGKIAQTIVGKLMQ